MFRIFIAFFIFFLIACNPLRHYQKVATDTKVTENKKAVIAPWVHLNFPVIPTFIKGRTDTIIEVQELPGDTTTYYERDTIKTTVIGPQRVVTKIIHTTDTLRIEGTALSDALRRQLAICGAEVIKKDAEITALKEKPSYFWWFIAACTAFVLSIILHFKRR